MLLGGFANAFRNSFLNLRIFLNMIIMFSSLHSFSVIFIHHSSNINIIFSNSAILSLSKISDVSEIFSLFLYQCSHHFQVILLCYVAPFHSSSTFVQ